MTVPPTVNNTIIAFYVAQTKATSEVSVFSGEDAPAMLPAYVTANTLVDLIQKASALIEELRRYGPEGYVPRKTKDRRPEGILKKPATKKKAAKHWPKGLVEITGARAAKLVGG